MNQVFIIIGTAFVTISLAVALMFGVMVLHKHYYVWSLEMQGKAELARATQSKQILIEQAKAEFEASKKRAKAIEVIGAAAQKYPEYRMQEFIGAFGQALENKAINTIIYVPTEANIPILEAGRIKK